jgi:transcriptional regulator MraZ
VGYNPVRTAGPGWRGSSHSATSVRLRPADQQAAWALAFHGTFDHTLDAKNRLTVPSKFRAALAGKVFLVKGADPCISVYPDATYTAISSAALSGMNPLSSQARELSRFFYANAMESELDGAGRIMLPARFMEHAGIAAREVIVAGAGDCLELWDRASWEAYDSDLTKRAPDLTASLGHPA